MENSEISRVLEKLDKIMENQALFDKRLDVHIEGEKETRKLAVEATQILRGHNGDVGLVSKVAKNTEELAAIKKAIWKIMTPLLTAIGVGIVVLIAMGVK